MSIIIKTEEVNYLIYRYFQEQGLQHSAFALNNEAQLDQIAKNYYDQTRPGHLIYLLEKALIFQQLQDHINLNSYYECTVPTQLISRHLCQFTQRKQNILQAEIKEKEKIINNAINRSQQNYSQTLDINYSEEHFLKIMDYVQFSENEEITLSDWNNHNNLLAAYFANQNCIKQLQCKANQQFQTLYIIPTCIGESFHRVKIMKWDKAHGNYLLILFENGVALVTDNQCQIIKMFNIKNVQKITNIEWNLNWPNLATIIFERDIEIIDVFKCQTIRVLDNILYFEWRYFDQFIIMDNNYFINLYQIDVDKPIMSFKADVETNLIKFNQTKSLLATFSKVLNNIKIWSFQTDQFIFEITDDQKLNNFCWCSSCNYKQINLFIINIENTNYLIALSVSQIIVWDVEFGQIKQQFNVEENIINLISLEILNEQPTIALISNNKNLFINDLIQKKRRVIQLQSQPKDMQLSLIYSSLIEQESMKRSFFYYFTK